MEEVYDTKYVFFLDFDSGLWIERLNLYLGFLIYGNVWFVFLVWVMLSWYVLVFGIPGHIYAFLTSLVYSLYFLFFDLSQGCCFKLVQGYAM